MPSGSVTNDQYGPIVLRLCPCPSPALLIKFCAGTKEPHSDTFLIPARHRTANGLAMAGGRKSCIVRHHNSRAEPHDGCSLQNPADRPLLLIWWESIFSEAPFHLDPKFRLGGLSHSPVNGWQFCRTASTNANVPMAPEPVKPHPSAHLRKPLVLQSHFPSDICKC